MANIWSCTLKEDVEKLQELILDGVSVDSKNDLGETPLLLAASRGLEGIAKVNAWACSIESLRTCIGAGCMWVCVVVSSFVFVSQIGFHTPEHIRGYTCVHVVHPALVHL